MSTLRIILLVLPLAASLACAAEPLRVHLTGKSQDFHQAHESLTSLAAELRDRYGAQITVTPTEKSPDFPALDAADVLVLYVRHTTPPTNVLQRVKDWCAAGKPVVALRSTSRPFLNWPEFDRTVLGCRYASHSKDVPVVTLSVPSSATEHPVLAGVKPWESRCARMVHYYFDNLADNTQVLLTGTDGAKPQPAAWVRTPKDNFRGRVFYTSLGLPEDFKEPNYRRLLINAIFWVADRPVPVLSDGTGTTSTKPAPGIKDR